MYGIILSCYPRVERLNLLTEVYGYTGLWCRVEVILRGVILVRIRADWNGDGLMYDILMSSVDGGGKAREEGIKGTGETNISASTRWRRRPARKPYYLKKARYIDTWCLLHRSVELLRYGVGVAS